MAKVKNIWDELVNFGILQLCAVRGQSISGRSSGNIYTYMVQHTWTVKLNIRQTLVTYQIDARTDTRVISDVLVGEK